MAEKIILNELANSINELEITQETLPYFLELLQLPDRYFRPVFIGLLEKQFSIVDLIPSKIQKAIQLRFYNSDLINDLTKIEQLEESVSSKLISNISSKLNNKPIGSIITSDQFEQDQLIQYISEIFQLSDLDGAIIPSKVTEITLKFEDILPSDSDLEKISKTGVKLHELIKNKQIQNMAILTRVNTNDE